MKVFDVLAYVKDAMGDFATVAEIEYVFRFVQWVGFGSHVNEARLDELRHFVDMAVSDVIGDKKQAFLM